MNFVPLAVSLSLFASILAGCAKTDKDLVLDTGRCVMAGRHLDDAELKAAGETYLRVRLAHVAGNSRDAMFWSQELRDEIEPKGSSTDIRHVLATATKWKESKHCQTAVTEFRAAIELEATRVAAIKSSEKCADLQDQVKFVQTPFTGKYKAATLAAMKDVLDSGVRDYPESQKQFALREIAARPQEIGQSVATACGTGTPLGDAIAPVVLAKFVSPRTAGLDERLKALPAACGDLPELYCRASFEKQGITESRKISERCDKQLAQTGDCALNADALVSRESDKLEVATLNEALQKFSRQLADPRRADHNFDGNVRIIAEQCKQRAVREGLRGAAYQERAKGTCEPQAVDEYLKPKREMVVRVKARLAQLAPSGAELPKQQ